MRSKEGTVLQKEERKGERREGFAKNERASAKQTREKKAPQFLDLPNKKYQYIKNIEL